MRRSARLVLAAILSLAPAAAFADQYDFLAAPQKDLNRIFRLDKITGEVGACQYALSPGKTDIAPGAVGITLCFPAGEGAGPQDPSEYALIASHHEGEGGVWRLDLRKGTMSICYVLTQDDYNKVVCTPAAK
ncbi:hypothetical protein [Methylovirgula sp. 4M-Z18]|uniref:hypothetical protein n=1 Tax=Methylovirgula sp. 4M-Z18 TaxID=2293567 RepID=UPI000E2EFA70|nr:hypothetical protein [Methylovirgula sp. 4M-Z18]RFB80162.1 hypothetical protein DYH55_01040 [Methylovirgula sp. 4M-Z18]